MWKHCIRLTGFVPDWVSDADSEAGRALLLLRKPDAEDLMTASDGIVLEIVCSRDYTECC